MARKKTSFMVDEDLWKEWTLFVVRKTGSARKLSEELEKALREYMEKHESKMVLGAKYSKKDLN